MVDTKSECLGHSCRFYYVKPDNTCFFQGVLPRCSPGLKACRRKLDEAAPDMREALEEACSDVTRTGYVKVQNVVKMQQALAKAKGGN